MLKAQVSDLPEELLTRLQEHEHLEISGLEVSVRNGIAYIEGAVPSLKQKRLATDVTREVRGVRDVVNMLRIVPH